MKSGEYSTSLFVDEWGGAQPILMMDMLKG